MKKQVAWWDKFGKPQYGGEIVIRSSGNIVNFDPYFDEGLTTIHSAWMERPVADEWITNPAEWDYRTHFRFGPYVKGHLAESYEFPDSNTYIIHLRKGINWQNIPPVNGREFTADDVAYHYHRLFGLGSGFTKPGLYHAKVVTAYRDLISVTAIDRYTVVFRWKTPGLEFMRETLQAPTNAGCIEAREAVEKWGDVSDWHHAIGTGPFILKNFVSGSSATLTRNPDYWGHDERYPQNQLPYIDKLKFRIIRDDAEALDAMRLGEIDVMGGISLSQSQALKKTNPEILQLVIPAPNAETIDPRNDLPPFNDIRVRKALQLALDLPAIARNYYNGTVEPYPCALTSGYMKGWGYPYEEWPQDLKDEYVYNPAKSKKLLADAGYPNGFKTNIVADKMGDLGLLQVAGSYFARVGIDMEIRPVETDTWISDVKKGHRHDQLAHRTGQGQLGHDMEPLRQLNPLLAGYISNFLMITDSVAGDFYYKALKVNGIDEMKSLIRDANEYFARQHFTISLLHPMRYYPYQPWLKGYNGQYFSVTAGTGGPALLFFYPARFWVDRKLKYSMTH
jgi:peptide/nickel transport system substrate-binding protein